MTYTDRGGGTGGGSGAPARSPYAATDGERPGAAKAAADGAPRPTMAASDLPVPGEITPRRTATSTSPAAALARLAGEAPCAEAAPRWSFPATCDVSASSQHC